VLVLHPPPPPALSLCAVFHLVLISSFLSASCFQLDVEQGILGGL
jgi:hypothetical protein